MCGWKSINLHFRSLIKSHCKSKISIIVGGWWYKYQYSDKKNIYIKVKNKKQCRKKTLKKTNMVMFQKWTRQFTVKSTVQFQSQNMIGL